MLMSTNIASSIFIPIILHFFFYSIYSIDIQKHWKRFIPSLLLLITTSCLCFTFSQSAIFNIVMISIINIFILMSYDKDNILEYIFISLYFIFIKLLSYVIVTWFMNLIAYEVIFPISYTISLSDILLLLFLFMTRSFFQSYLIQIREYTLFYITIHIVLILLYLSYLITIFKKGELFIESSIEILLITILVFLIYKMVNKIINVEKENYLMKLESEELKFNQKNYEHINDNINEIKKIKHDMNHVLLLLLDCCHHQNYNELQDILTHQLNDIKNTNLINTGNPSLDLILSSRLSKIKKENIEFISNTFHDEIDIDKIDFYILLGNLLDNAIENCHSQSVRKILFDLSVEDDSLIINLKNTCIHNPLLTNPQFHTHKKESTHHGFGMNTIENIVKKYDGQITYDYSYHYFIVSIKLKNISLTQS